MAKRYPGIEGEVFESSLLKDIYFEFDRYDIRPEAAPLLRENATLLMKYPKMKIQIEGHCDERGTSEYNLSLGERRANSAMNQLISLGISGIASLQSVSVKRGLLIQLTLRQPGPRTEGPTWSSYPGRRKVSSLTELAEYQGF